MKASYAALGSICLAIAGLWYLGGGIHFPLSSTAAAEEMFVSAPVAHENLTVFFIHGPDKVATTQIMTLQEAIDSGRAIVHETGQVNTLAVENLSSDSELFMQEGDIIRGGRQDRLIARDMLVSPKSGQVAFPCNCVENGRWTGRGNEAATHFNKCDNFVVGNPTKIANINQEQSVVWDQVEKQKKVISTATKVNVDCPASPSSLQLALENPAVKEKAGEYESKLKTEGETRDNVIGVVFLVNGEVSGVEMYGSNALFRKAWPKLLRSAATEAMADKTEKRIPPAPTSREMERYLARVGNMEPAATSSTGATGRANLNFTNVDLNRLLDLTNEDVGMQMNLEAALPEIQRVEGQPNSPVTATGASSSPNPSPTGQAERPRRVGRIIIQGNEVMGDRVILNQVDLRPGQPIATQPGTVPGQPQQSNGSRLNVNRVENASGVISESRDSSRQNAVIHMSFIKK